MNSISNKKNFCSQTTSTINISPNSIFLRRLKRQKEFEQAISKDEIKIKVRELALRLGIVLNNKLNCTYLIKNCGWMNDLKVTDIKKTISNYLMNKKINDEQTEILINLHSMKLIDNSGAFYYDVTLTRALLSELLQIFKNHNNYRNKTYLVQRSREQSKAV